VQVFQKEQGFCVSCLGGGVGAIFGVSACVDVAG